MLKVAGGGIGGGASSITNADGTLTISPATGSVVASINLANSNNWTNATASTSPTTGALVVTGGVGVGGAINSALGATFATTSGNVGIGTTSPSALLSVGSTSQFQVSSVGNVASISGFATLLSSPAAATLQHGGADAASPVAQTIKFQDVVAGTSNTAAPNATYNAPAGTGTGAGGSHVWTVAPAGTTGSAKNAQVTALTIDSTGLTTFNFSSVKIDSPSGSYTGTGNVYLDATNGGNVYLRVAGFQAPFGVTAGGAATLGITGEGTATTTNATLRGAFSVGTDIAGGTITISSGRGTGAATPSQLIFQTPVAVASGTGAQTMTTQMTINSTAVSMTNLTASGTITGGAVTVGSGLALKLGNAATTGLAAGVLAATTNATITITDSTGQVYRVPCII